MYAKGLVFRMSVAASAARGVAGRIRVLLGVYYPGSYCTNDCTELQKASC